MKSFFKHKDKATIIRIVTETYQFLIMSVRLSSDAISYMDLLFERTLSVI